MSMGQCPSYLATDQVTHTSCTGDITTRMSGKNMNTPWSRLFFCCVEFCINRSRERSPCWLLPEMRQSSSFFFFLLFAAAVYCLFWFLLCCCTKHIFCTALFCMLHAATTPGLRITGSTEEGLLWRSFWLALMLIGRSELTKLVARPHKESNICCLIRPDKNTLVTFVSPL